MMGGDLASAEIERVQIEFYLDTLRRSLTRTPDCQLWLFQLESVYS